MKKIFVSYNFNDKKISHSVKGMSKDSNGPVNGRFVFVEGDVAFNGSDAIDLKIRNTMQNCNVALFLIGNNNHNSPWIEREVELATSKGFPILVMRLPNANGGIPHSLRNRSYKECSWGANNLANLI
ncbi:TIR domain-containing protein [Aliivibrio sifiae]